MKTEKLPWFACYPKDLLEALSPLDPDVSLLYVIILLRIYEHGGPIPDKLTALSNRTNMTLVRTRRAFDELLSVGKIITSDGLISNPRAESEIEIRQEKQSAHAERASNAANIRWEKDKQKQEGRKKLASALHETSMPQIQGQLEKQEQSPSQNPTTTHVGSKKPNRRPRSSDDYTTEFLSLWDNYPRKVGGSKKNAYKQWNRLSDAQRATVIRVMPTWRTLCRKKDEQYIKHLEFFLSAAIFETLEQATIIAKDESAVIDPAQFSDARWTTLLGVYRITNDWKQAWGPPPGYAGCLLPVKFIEQMSKSPLDAHSAAV